MHHGRISGGILVAVVGLLASGCGGGETKSELGDARDTWDKADVSSYRLVVESTCFCPPDFKHTATTVVRDGRVVTRTGDKLAATVEELFEQVDDAMDEADEVKVSYDARYGYPRQIATDRDKGVTDDESTLSVVRFTPLPAPA
jgi:hypothetical protein